MPHFCPDAVKVCVLEGYVLRVQFADGSVKDCDLSGLAEKGVFTRIKDTDFFRKAHAQDGAVVWDDDLDIAPEYLYDNGVPLISSLSSL